jgi:hypothetical protein
MIYTAIIIIIETPPPTISILNDKSGGRGVEIDHGSSPLMIKEVADVLQNLKKSLPEGLKSIITIILKQ